jgi:mitochondrial fission protein ELM1
MPSKEIKLWVITEGMAGTENQCLAVADYLGISDIHVKRIGLKFPFNILCPFIFKIAPKWAIMGIDWDEEVEPDIIIASGRKAVPVALRFKNAFTVFLQNPRVNPQNFDLCAIPEHDNIAGKNVILTKGAPNRITPEILDKARQNFDFSYLPDKKIAVLIGGNSKTHKLPDNFALKLYEDLMPYMQSGDYGILISASRRTPDHVHTALRNFFNTTQCEVWSGDGRNPYHAYLAHADYILVTEDSTSMLSDALTTGKPTYRLALNGGSEKFDFLYRSLKRRTMLKTFDGELETWDYKRLNDAQYVANEIKKRFF